MAAREITSDVDCQPELIGCCFQLVWQHGWLSGGIKILMHRKSVELERRGFCCHARS
jgi:hypothetical protein